MELSELSKERLEGVDERLKAVVIECAARCPFPFNVSEGLRTEEKQREYVKQGRSKTMKSKHLTGKAVDLYPCRLVQVRGAGRPDVSGGQRPRCGHRLGWQLEDVCRQVPF